MGRIFCIMGKSSSGKDTVYKEIRKIFPDIKKITMYTTRPIRQGETDGDEYRFVGEDKLSEMARAGKVIEEREYDTKCGVWKYFTANDGSIDLKKNNYLVIGTLQSFASMKKFFGPDKVVGIYLETDDGVLLRRALERELKQDEPKLDEMCRRFLADREDFSDEKLREAGLEKYFQNNCLDTCVDEVAGFIRGKL